MVILTVVSTKGGIGKTTVTANLSAVLADMGFRVLMIDTDTQASLSKFYPIHYRAPNGVVELLFGKNDESVIQSTISNTVYPNLDIVLSNNIRDDVQFARDFLAQEKVLIVQGTGFNWIRPDHFRVVTLPHQSQIEEAIERLARFLHGYRQ